MATGEINDYIAHYPGTRGLLFIEPAKDPSPLPLIDELTRKMTAAWRVKPVPNIMHSYFGHHTCKCGVGSDNHTIENKYVTNSLCIHYLAFHRDEVPQIELDKVAKLEYDPVEPTVEEMVVPDVSRREKFIRPQRIPRTPICGAKAASSRITRCR